LLVESLLGVLGSGVLGVGRGLGEVHIEDIVAEQHSVPGFCQNLGNLLGVLDLPDVQVSWVSG
jgi:hypothetical protein